MLTDVDMWLASLEGRRQTTGGELLMGEDMVHRVDSPGPEQRGSAGAEEEVG